MLSSLLIGARSLQKSKAWQKESQSKTQPHHISISYPHTRRLFATWRHFLAQVGGEYFTLHTNYFRDALQLYPLILWWLNFSRILAPLAGCASEANLVSPRSTRFVHICRSRGEGNPLSLFSPSIFSAKETGPFHVAILMLYFTNRKGYFSILLQGPSGHCSRFSNSSKTLPGKACVDRGLSSFLSLHLPTLLSVCRRGELVGTEKAVVSYDLGDWHLATLVMVVDSKAPRLGRKNIYCSTTNSSIYLRNADFKCHPNGMAPELF